MRRHRIVPVLLIAALPAARADSVKLKVGTVLRGDIVAETETELTIREKGAGGAMTIRKADVAKVTRDKAPPSPGAGPASTAAAASGAGGVLAVRRRSAYVDIRWLSEDEPVPSGAEAKQIREREGEYGTRADALRKAGDAAGLRALGREIVEAAAAVPGEDGDRLERRGRDTVLESLDLETAALMKEGAALKEERALAVARAYAAIDVPGESHNTRGMTYWYVQAALRSPDPYRYDLELRDGEVWDVLYCVRGGQRDRWKAAEPRIVTVGHTLPAYRHQRGGLVAADDEPPRPFPEEQRAWERCNDRPAFTGFLVPRNNPTLSDWHELLWDVQTRSWEKATTLERLRAEEEDLLSKVLETRADLDAARYKLDRARTTCRHGWEWMVVCRRGIKAGDARSEAFEGKRIAETQAKIDAARADGRAALQRHRDAVRLRAQRIEAWEKHRERLLALMADEKKALGRNYAMYLPIQE